MPAFLRHNRVVRFLRAGLTILAAVLRYQWLRVRARLGTVPQARWDRAHARTGRAIYRLATTYAGAFVKLGQILGARGDVLPPALIDPLRGLHDKVPPRPFARLRGHLERELGRPLDEVFASIDERALAAASLAQVHRARLVTGEDVVVKIQYPEARRLFPVDLGSMRRGVRVARWLAKIDLRALADELAEMVCLELEFEREAASTERVRAAFAGVPGVRIPRVYRELSTDRIMVLEFVEGRPLTDLDGLRADGVDLRAVAGAVAEVYATMMFDHGFFQGDPHPGNLFVGPDRTTIVVLDFGLAKELPPGFADGAATMLVGAMTGDVDGAIAAARAIGFDATGDAAAFRDVIQMIMGDHRGKNPLAALQAVGLRRAPSHFAVMVRALILLNGLSHALVPGERVIAQAVARRLMPRVMAARAAAAPAAADGAA